MTRIPTSDLSLAETHLIHKLRRLYATNRRLYFLTLRLLHAIIDLPLDYQTLHPKETDHER